MLGSYCRLAIRSIRKQPLFAAIMTSGLALAIALLTVSGLALRAASANPVRTLRHE